MFSKWRVWVAAIAGGMVFPGAGWAETREERGAEGIPSEHAKTQTGRLNQIRQLAGAGQFAEAVALVEVAKAEAKGMVFSDPRRVDGDEMQVALMAAQGKFAEAKPLSEQVVAARRAGAAGEKLLLSTTLLQHVIVTDGAGDTATADQALQDAIRAGGDAFGPGDARRPRMLEAFGDLLAQGYNRPLAGLRLYEAAIRDRELGPLQSRRELAETLRKMALVEPPLGRDVSADAHLQRAIVLLKAEHDLAVDASVRAEIAGDLATLYGSRVGLAARGQRFDDGRALLAAGRALAVGTAPAPYMELWAAELDRREAEAKGLFAEALGAARRGAGVAQGLGDAGLVAGLQLIEGRLQIEGGDLAGAEAVIKRGLATFADMPTPEGAKTAEGWLLLARIERARGQEARASRWVTAALAMMKTRRSEVPVLFGTNRTPRPGEPGLYGTAAADVLSFGQALVLVPGTAPIAATGLSTLGGATALERLLVVNVHGLDPASMAAAAAERQRTAKLYPKTALVFVHGFGTTFEFALARAAQIARDIGYDGPVFSFAWPSQGKVDPFAYGADEKAAAESVVALGSFLHAVAEASGADKIHVIAHSMGNQILLKALAKIRSRGDGLSGRIGEVVFASPDVGQAEFQTGTAALHGQGMTLYASANDKALWVSFVRNASIRAGSVAFGLLSPGKPVITRGVDSIDVSDAGRDYFNANHDVYASNPYVANDLRRLLQAGERPPHRRSQGVLVERGQAPDVYWAFDSKVLQ